MGWSMLALYYFLNIDLTTALLIPSGSAIIVYVIGSASGIKLLKQSGHKRLLPWTSLAASIIMLPFVGPLLVVSLAILLVGLFYRAFRGRKAPESVVKKRDSLGIELFPRKPSPEQSSY